ELSLVFQRTGQDIDYPAGEKIDDNLAAELIAHAALDQAGAEALFRGCGDYRATGLGPFQSEFRLVAFRNDLPNEPHRTGLIRKRAVLCSIGGDLVQDHRQYHRKAWGERNERSRD